MIVSHSKRFIFVHVYKVAGNSIRRALNRFNNQSYPESSMLEKLKFMMGSYPKVFSQDFHSHATARELRAQLPRDTFDNYFKFAFVRNPWDWQVSLYQFMLEKEDHPQHEIVKSMAGFDAYLDWRIGEDFHTQNEFVTDDSGNLIVDYVGRFENLHQNFLELRNRLELGKIRLPHLNKSGHQNYQKYYTPNTRKLVNDAFRSDIEMFGYTF